MHKPVYGRKLPAEMMVVFYLAFKQHTTKDLASPAWGHGQTFTTHEIEEGAREWWAKHGVHVSGATLVRAMWRVLRSGVLGTVTKTKPKDKSHYVFRFDASAGKLLQELDRYGVWRPKHGVG